MRIFMIVLPLQIACAELENDEQAFGQVGGDDAACSAYSGLNEVGRVWQWRNDGVWGDESASFGITEVSALGLNTLGEDEVWQVETIESHDVFDSVPSVSSVSSYRCDERGVWLVHVASQTIGGLDGFPVEIQSEIRLTSPLLWLPADLAVGTTWDSDVVAEHYRDGELRSTESYTLTAEALERGSYDAPTGLFDTIAVAYERDEDAYSHYFAEGHGAVGGDGLGELQGYSD